jgi:hypothetical protein
MTSTYFESSQPGDQDDKRRFGRSRDKRNDCVQAGIVLIVTADGFPHAYEVLPGKADCTTQRDALRKIEGRYGKDRSHLDHGSRHSERGGPCRDANGRSARLRRHAQGPAFQTGKALRALPWQAVRERFEASPRECRRCTCWRRATHPRTRHAATQSSNGYGRFSTSAAMENLARFKVRAAWRLIDVEVAEKDATSPSRSTATSYER